MEKVFAGSLIGRCLSGRLDASECLAELLKTYFWRAGYFVVRGVPYRLEDEDSDIDHGIRRAHLPALA
jgi:hypothetical protein